MTPSTTPLRRNSGILPVTAFEPLRVLAYFDVFHYPLSKEEICLHVNGTISGGEMTMLLGELVRQERLFLHHGFYSLHNNPLLALRRREGNERARHMIPQAMRIGRLLSCFPFVRSVSISGSLSKNFADEQADMDYFIITKSNRLWMARTLLHVFKKMNFLVRRQHQYCMNYFVDEEALLIAEQNVFTALEIKTLIPVSCAESFAQFRQANQWCDDFLPNLVVREPGGKPAAHWWVKSLVERIFDNRIANWLDDYLMRVTTARWMKKRDRHVKNEKGLEMCLLTGKHFARSNPGAFQEWVLGEYNRRLAQLGLL